MWADAILNEIPVQNLCDWFTRELTSSLRDFDNDSLLSLSKYFQECCQFTMIPMTGLNLSCSLHNFLMRLTFAMKAFTAKLNTVSCSTLTASDCNYHFAFVLVRILFIWVCCHTTLTIEGSLLTLLPCSIW